MPKLTFTAGRDYARAEDFLRRECRISATVLKRAKYGHLFRNGEALRTSEPIRRGDLVTVEVTDEVGSDIPPIPLPLEILYEDDYLLAICKPSQMPVHPSRGNSLPTLANAVVAYLDDPCFVFRAIMRLDRDTSGIVLIAKDANTASILGNDLKEGRIEKRYLAVTEGTPIPAEGTVSAPIARECEGAMRRIVTPDGKRAVTAYRVLSPDDGNGALCEVRPLTGRTHQIRVHMAAIGHPLRGDFLYGTRRDGETYRLHAYEVRFRHPITKDAMTIRSIPDFALHLPGFNSHN